MGIDKVKQSVCLTSIRKCCIVDVCLVEHSCRPESISWRVLVNVEET